MNNQELRAMVEEIVAEIRDDAENDKMADITNASVEVVLAAAKLIGLYNEYFSKHNKKILINGERKTLHEWADETGIPYKTLRKRIFDNGWKPEDAVTTPVLNPGVARNFHKTVTVNQYNPKQELMRTFESMSECARQCGIPMQTIKGALEGMNPLEQVARWGYYFTTPKTLSQKELEELMGA